MNSFLLSEATHDGLEQLQLLLLQLLLFGLDESGNVYDAAALVVKFLPSDECL